MKVIKLDGRHRMRRDFGMQYAVVWNRYEQACRPYEKWLESRFGSSWFRYNSHWKSGHSGQYSRKDRPTYYIAVKEERTLTMMFLALGGTNE